MSAPADVDVVVVGAGVVGLACARALVQGGRSVYVLEREERAGEGVSSRNSGVIHAGFYYPTGSLKARLCLRGRDLLYRYCEQRGIACQRIGKWVVAQNPAEVAALHALAARGEANGVSGLRMLSPSEIREGEPELQAMAAMLSPDSGIVDVPELVMALVGEIERSDRAEGRVICGVEVSAIRRDPLGFRIETSIGDRVIARQVVNAAGLGATVLASRIEGLAPQHVPALYYGAGHYYTLRGRVPFSRLIYPMPEPGGLGVHLGFDLVGRARFGPDLRYRDTINYDFDDSRREQFARAVERWWPAIDAERLQPDFVGVRPKLVGPGEHNRDFVISGAEVHGMAGLINLFGIESPGLTSSLAIGEEVAARLSATAAG